MKRALIIKKQLTKVRWINSYGIEAEYNKSNTGKPKEKYRNIVKGAY